MDLPPEKKLKLFNEESKVRVHLNAVGSTPIYPKNKFNMDKNHTINDLYQKLKPSFQKHIEESGKNLFLYVSDIFEPNKNERIGNLFMCYHEHGVLYINYSLGKMYQ
eukprot:TRINITY_DN4196_c0_g1_i1.p1 TRINITY_DN4196_c0_g1~~TRINITY_DN4196_c0_g1_i1.p1  ORF type:complete len:107 (-),score=27.27 TRINITY_DN4196_c0_g1_i1:185-505(-)